MSVFDFLMILYIFSYLIYLFELINSSTLLAQIPTLLGRSFTLDAQIPTLPARSFTLIPQSSILLAQSPILDEKRYRISQNEQF